MAARNAKLTPQLRSKLCEYLKKGHPKRSAAALVGIHRDTLNAWEIRGRLARSQREEGLEVPATERPYLALVDEVEQAYDYGEGWLFEQMLDAAAGGKDNYLKRWQAYMTALERSRPDAWRRRSSAEYVKPDAERSSRGIDFDKLTPTQRAALKEILLEAIADD